MIDGTPTTFFQFRSERHALYVGWIMGIAAKHGIICLPVLDDVGNYTDKLQIMFGEPGHKVTLTVVVPPPPKDWLP